MKSLVLFHVGLRLPFVWARLECSSTVDCAHGLRKSSTCVNGYCTNPYHGGGCLVNSLENYSKVRTCHSDDPPSAMENEYCRPSALGYSEVRVASQNWESAIFVSWILQIILSEVLNIPVSIETGTPDANMDFYNINTAFDYGVANDWEAVKRAKQFKDCTKLKWSDEYLSCAHVVPEAWPVHGGTLNTLRQEQVIENPAGLGLFAEQFWFIRRRTAEQYPSFVSYVGLQGEERRPLLAEVFKRPTTWDDYCNLVSDDNCQTPDKYAGRAPALDDEGGKYYLEGSYTGYFRATAQNDCTNNTACTGHIVDYPCDWVSFAVQQSHHLGIHLESSGKEKNGGYTYSEMVQIWNAANATDSHVMMIWWRPETVYQEFLGTGSEFQSVALPPTTQDCVDHRINPADRCGSDEKLKFGDPLGACGEGPQFLLKVVSTALFEISVQPNIPEALHSPGYEAIKNFRISELQIGKIFEYWLQRDSDKYGLDPRDATCQWVIENLDILLEMIPRSHPRTMREANDVYQKAVFNVAICVACLAIFGTLCGSLLVVLLRNKAAIRNAQIEFLFLLLMGLLLVSIGSLLTALPPTHQLCVTIVWLVNFGYTLELVPLIIKVSAIHRMIVASKRMRRVRLRKSSLFIQVLLFCLLVGAYLIVWTVVDPPRRDADLKLTDEKSESNEIIIERVFFCSPNHVAWDFAGVSWQALLLLCASIMAFQTRNVREDLNETRTLPVMIYSHTVLVVLRAVTYGLDGSLGYADVAAARSITYSVDVIATLGIYLVPKFFYEKSGSSLRISITDDKSGELSRQSISVLGNQENLPDTKSEFKRRSHRRMVTSTVESSVDEKSHSRGAEVGTAKMKTSSERDSGSCSCLAASSNCMCEDLDNISETSPAGHDKPLEESNSLPAIHESAPIMRVLTRSGTTEPGDTGRLVSTVDCLNFIDESSVDENPNGKLKWSPRK